MTATMIIIMIQHSHMIYSLYAEIAHKSQDCNLIIPHDN